MECSIEGVAYCVIEYDMECVIRVCCVVCDRMCHGVYMSHRVCITRYSQIRYPSHHYRPSLAFPH